MADRDGPADHGEGAPADDGDYDAQRMENIRRNREAMAKFGLVDAAAQLTADIIEPRRTARVKTQRQPVNVAPAKKSKRQEGKDRVDYAEPKMDIMGEFKRPAYHRKKPSGEGGTGTKNMNPGRRIVGNRIYDSEAGVSCHWCRQKTVEDHVTCTSSTCTNPGSMKVSFCARCLLNRNGEDAISAHQTGKWVCPRCRGSCGPGCTSCCNCGPCRKRKGLQCTGQLKQEQVRAGFDNAHDYLVHVETGESQLDIAKRKMGFEWSAFLSDDALQSADFLYATGEREADDDGAVPLKPQPKKREPKKAKKDKAAPKPKPSSSSTAPNCSVAKAAAAAAAAAAEEDATAAPVPTGPEAGASIDADTDADQDGDDAFALFNFEDSDEERDEDDVDPAAAPAEQVAVVASGEEVQESGPDQLPAPPPGTGAGVSALVGRRVSVWWNGERAWFNGIIRANNTVLYDDGFAYHISVDAPEPHKASASAPDVMFQYMHDIDNTWFKMKIKSHGKDNETPSRSRKRERQEV